MCNTLLFLGTLAILNVFAYCLALPALEAIGCSHDVGIGVRNALNKVQLNLLGLLAALLSRRPAASVVVIFGLVWLEKQWYEIVDAYSYGYHGRLQSPWIFVRSAMFPCEVLTIFHALRIACGWRLTREPKIDVRAGQFQTRDLLEWMFTVAVTLSVATWTFAQLQQPLPPGEMLSIWVYSALRMLTVCPLALVLLSERPKVVWFLGIAISWVVLLAAAMCWGSWQDTGSVWPNRVVVKEFLDTVPAHHVAMLVAILVNSLALRRWGYRWRSPPRQPVAS
jgi:hypothetical protein